VILTRHSAGSTAEAQGGVGFRLTMQCAVSQTWSGAECGESASLSHEEYVVLAPYIDLAGRLGSFLAQTGNAALRHRPDLWGLAGEAKTELVRSGHRRAAAGSENVNRSTRRRWRGNAASAFTGED